MEACDDAGEDGRGWGGCVCARGGKGAVRESKSMSIRVWVWDSSGARERGNVEWWGMRCHDVDVQLGVVYRRGAAVVG